MELRQLRYFVGVAEELHFSRAAARLYVAQPALSHQIAKLERELGVTLLRRSTRSVELTTAGESFLADAREILRRLELAAERARQAATARRGCVSIGLSMSVVPHALSRLIAEFQELADDGGMALHEIAEMDAVGALREGLVDAVILRGAAEDTGLEGEVLLDEAMVVALPPNHRLAGESSVSLADLRGERFVHPSRRTHPRCYTALVERCVRYGFTPATACEADSVGTLPTLVVSGAGVAVMPESAPAPTHPGAVAELRGETTSTSIAWLPDRRPALVQELIALAHAARETSRPRLLRSVGEVA